MTPKDKAEQLVDKFHEYSSDNVPNFLEYQPEIAIRIAKYSAKQCAILCVDEIIQNEKVDDVEENNLYYWEEVRQEIYKL